MACDCIFRSEVSLPCVCGRDLVALSGWVSLSLSSEAAFSLPFSFPFPEQVHPQLTVVLVPGSRSSSLCRGLGGVSDPPAESLQVVEVHHGPSSVEMGHELFKLAQVFFNG